MKFYAIFFMHPFKQPGRWQDVLDQKSLPENEHFVV